MTIKAEKIVEGDCDKIVSTYIYIIYIYINN